MLRLRVTGNGCASRRWSVLWCGMVAGGFLASAAWLPAQTLDLKRVFDERNLPPVRVLIQEGEYQQVARLSELYIQNGAPSPEWWILRLEALRALGRKDDVLRVAKEAALAHGNDLKTLMACHDAVRAYGQRDVAASYLQQVNAAAKKQSASQRTAQDLVVLGRAALAAGADPQKVVAQFYVPAKKKDRTLLDAYLAGGELALQKSDFAKAADEFRAGLKEHSQNNDLRYGLARAFQSSDRKQSLTLAQQVVESNRSHAGALLLLAEHSIGAEQFAEADKALDAVTSVNEDHPEAWAMRSVLATLVSNREKEAASARKQALEAWAQNPEVDYVIGRCLSRAYRFQEASDHLREAVKMDPGHLEAKLQLCHALFRLGREDEAWKLGEEIRKADAYNVQAYNIGLLEAEMKGFAVRTEPDFVLKMPTRDAAIYGDRALQLLREAKEVLCARYGLELDHPVLVEFFPSQQDFAIRTFGNLGGQGILGACFGTVVTMNSPGSVAANRSNWESTLWHEFCHVVTLTVTRNRMPRWLSEGISVYEEQRRDPAWGMRMSGTYRKMVLDDKTFTPLSKMSGAFLNPESSDHLMFAYFEAAQAVDWMIATYGETKFQGVLKDLAEGRRINEALDRNMASVQKLDATFAVHLKGKAQQLGSKADWTEPEKDALDVRDATAMAAWLKDRPNNLWGLRQATRRLLAGERWSEALEVSRRLITLFPEDPEATNGYQLAAQAYRGLKQTTEEAAMLREWMGRTADASQASLRLIELETEARQWPGVLAAVKRLLAIDPFLKRPHEAMAAAYEAQGDREGAVVALKHLMTLGPDNPVQVNFALARLLQPTDARAARLHVLDALAEAPRFRAGHELLLKLQPPAPVSTPAPTPPPAGAGTPPPAP